MKSATEFACGVAALAGGRPSNQRPDEQPDSAITKAVAALVRLGLESQEGRKREFFKKLRKNLSINDPKLEDQMVDEFRSLILGR